jgi:hypothetical protein
MAPQIKTFRRTLPMHKYVGFFRFGLFSMIAAMLTANPSAKAESYTLPGESSKPSAEEFIGTRGLVGIYYGHLPRDGHPRQKVTLVLLADPESGAPKGYVLERIGVAKMPNARFITKGSWKLIKDPNRPAAVIYELDSEAPSELRDFWEVDKSTLLVLEKDLRVQRSGFGDPYTVAYALYGLHCNPGQRMRDCSHE